ncbi:MAG: 5'-methylthioadenosine/S-adenosylhomocysteine nucleosidase, partial [bacterium]|nr:5'-methylthioadenosine/S-adenosylhomocysteine nucleosidase [bacterium]
HGVDQRLLIAAQNFQGQSWRETTSRRFDNTGARNFFGPICTGNKVVADASLAQQFREVWIKLIGVEMEAGGVAGASSQAACRPGFFMVRGVSDLADGAKDTEDVKQWRPYACEIAAAWAVEFLKSGPVPAATKTPSAGAIAGSKLPYDSVPCPDHHPENFADAVVALRDARTGIYLGARYGLTPHTLIESNVAGEV